LTLITLLLLEAVAAADGKEAAVAQVVCVQP
jgi:hypothetical protein